MKRYALFCAVWLSLARSGGQKAVASLDGFVTNDVAASIPAAKVGADSLTKGVHFEAVTNNAGYYMISEVPPGAYSMYAEVKGVGCIYYPRVAVQPGEHLRKDFIFLGFGHEPKTCAPKP